VLLLRASGPGRAAVGRPVVKLAPVSQLRQLVQIEAPSLGEMRAGDHLLVVRALWVFGDRRAERTFVYGMRISARARLCAVVRHGSFDGPQDSGRSRSPQPATAS